MNIFTAYFRHVCKNLKDQFYKYGKKDNEKKKHDNNLKNEWGLTDAEMFILFSP